MCLHSPGTFLTAPQSVTCEVTSASQLWAMAGQRGCSLWTLYLSAERSPGLTWPRLDTDVTVLGQQS